MFPRWNHTIKGILGIVVPSLSQCHRGDLRWGGSDAELTTDDLPIIPLAPRSK